MSHAEWFATARAEILAQPNAPSAQLIDTEGSVYNQICHAIAAGADAVEVMAQLMIDGLFLDTAHGDQLSRLGADRYNVVRNGASSAVVLLSVSRPTAAYGAVVVDSGTVVTTDDGARFELGATLSFAMAGLGPGLVEATAVEPGNAGNVAAGTIVHWDTPPDDSTLVVVNLERAAGGNEEEDDEAYRARVRASYLAARRATLAAIRQGALSLSTVREAATYETLDDTGKPSGSVIMTIADANGNANDQLVDDVTEAVVEYRAAGVGVFPTGGTPRYESIRLRITWRAGMATAENRRAVQQVVAAAVNRLDPRAAPAGEVIEATSKLTIGLIDAAARSVTGVVDVEVLTPVGTVVGDPGEVIRTRPELVEVVA